MATKTFLQGVSSKSNTGDLVPPFPIPIGVDFDNVIDTRTTNGHTLRQFFDNYLSFMTTANFIYCGDTTPTNKNIKIWIDTDPNADEF